MRTTSFRARSTLFVLATCAVTVTLACAAFLVYDRVTSRNALVGHMRTAAQIVGTNSTAALTFSDDDAAREILGALAAEPAIEAACLFTPDGAQFASYHSEHGDVPCPRAPRDEMYSFVDDELFVQVPVEHEREPIGTVLLISDLAPLEARTARFVWIVALILAASLAVAFTMASRLLGAVIRPLLTLTRTADHVTRTRDYSARAAKESTDEIGVLTESFNGMLDQIQSQQTALEAGRSELEQRVHDRTLALTRAKVEAEQVAESLRASEEQFRFLSGHVPVGIFKTDQSGGFTYANERLIAALEMSPLAVSGNGWQDAIHADDRDMVVAEWADTRRTGIDMSREFRVRGHDGDIRWVTMQARRLRDGDGREHMLGTIADITDRKQAERERELINQERLEMSRQAGMAEVATGVLHNVGNVLNSINVSAALLGDRIRGSAILQLTKAMALMTEHEHDLARYIAEDARGKLLPPYLRAVSRQLEKEREALLGEIESVTENMEHIKQIIAMQQAFARVGGLSETVVLSDLVDGALAVSEISPARNGIKVSRDYTALAPITVDKHKVLQILINLISNAKHSLLDSEPGQRELILRSRCGAGFVRIEVEDNGVGIPAENLARIFRFGFTTKRNGHGFGLHGSALAAKQLRGRLLCNSAGPGRGAQFVLELPAGDGAAERELDVA